MNKLEENEKSCTKDHSKLYQTARHMMKSKNYQNAIQSLENCINIKECFIEKSLKLDMYLILGLSYFHLSKYSDSSHYFLLGMEISNSLIYEYNPEKNNNLNVAVKILLYLSTISMFINNNGQAKTYYNKLEEKIINEENVENKISSIREILKILFNFGILKLNRKKSTLEEIDTLKKDLGFSPIMMIQSRLNNLFNNIVKDDIVISSWINFVNEKWIVHEFGNEKLFKVTVHLTDLFLSSKTVEISKKFFNSDLIKNSIKIDNSDNFFNDVKERAEMIKYFVKRLSNMIILNPSNSAIKIKDKLPKIPSTNKNLPSISKNINLFLNSSLPNDHEKETKTSPKLSDKKLFNTNSHRTIISAKDFSGLQNFLSNNSPFRNSNVMIHENHNEKKVELKASNIPPLKLENHFPDKRNLSVKGKVSRSKITINDSISRHSSEHSPNNLINSADFEKKNSHHSISKPRYSDSYLSEINSLNSKKGEENVKNIKVNMKYNGSIKDSLIHDRIDYKPIFEELKDYYYSYSYNRETIQSKISNFVIKYSSKSKPGKKSNNEEKINQDSFFTIENYMKIKNFFLFGVCDGHGLNGHMCSGHVKQYLPSNLHLIELNKLLTNEKKILNDKGKKKNVKEETKTKEYINKSNYRIFNEKNYDKMSFMQNLEIDKNFATNITEAFLKTQEDIIEREFEVNYSGSTVCSIFILGNIIYCANVGDSRCVLGRYEKDKKLQPLSISRDHKPSEPEEKERILSSGGRVEAFKNEDNEDVGPLRVWLKDEDVPGLAMSRSIGDIVSAKVGVISSPEISLYKISKNDKFLILASDGLWEFVSNEQAVQIVSRFWLIGDADGAVDELIRIASHYWEEKESVRDDITVIVIFIDITNKK